MDSSKEVYEKILKFEQELDLFELQIKDVYVWERIRHKIYKKICHQKNVGGETTPYVQNKWKTYYKALKNILKNFVWKNPYRTKNADIFFYGYSRREKLHDGKYWDIVSDPILNELNDDYVLYEKPRLDSHDIPAKTENIRYWDLIHYLPKLNRELGRGKISISEIEKQKLDNLNNQLNNWFNVRDNLLKRINWLLYQRKIKLPHFKYILKKVDPEVAVLSASAKFTFVEACSDLGIPTIQVQKGFRSSYNPKYNFPGNRPHRTFGDYQFVWGQRTKDMVDYPVDEDNIRIVGYPYLEMEYNRYKNSATTIDLLFISAAPYGEELSKFAVDCSKHFTNKSIKYKLHPGESYNWRDRYPWLIDSDIDVVGHNSAPLFKLISKSESIVGVSSSVLFQATKFNKNIMVYSHEKSKFGLELVNNDCATLVKRPKDIISAINTHESKCQPTYYFADDPIKKYKNNIRQIAERD